MSVGAVAHDSLHAAVAGAVADGPPAGALELLRVRVGQLWPGDGKRAVKTRPASAPQIK